MRNTWCLTSLLTAGVALASPDGGVAKKAPMPTEAECLGVGAPKLPLTFATGEELTFDIDALGAKAGKMTMRVLPSREGTLPVEVHAETNTFFSKVRRVNGTATSYLNPKTVRPGRYHEDSKENEVHRVADVTFRKDKTARLVSTIDGNSGEYVLGHGNDVTDVAGAIYLMRQINLKEGMRVCFDVYGIRGIWRVWGTVVPKEPVSMPVGQFTAWHLAGEAARIDFPDYRRQIHVWLTDDERRLPLAALGTLDLGAVRATLTAYARPKEKSAKAENKANLKW
jgi:hypothetical protein